VAGDREYTWSLPHATVSFHVSAATDRGRVRVVNEDSYVAAPPLFLVADGMGGHAYGDRASQEAAGILERALSGDRPVTPETVLTAVQDANRTVQSIGGDIVAGTTIAGIVLVQDRPSADPYWMAFNVGDSRIYRWDGEALVQLSVDHSAVQELLDGGEISVFEAVHHPDRNVITRALGAAGELDPDVWLLPAAGVHTYLLCSDGLTKELGDDAIAAVLREAPTGGVTDRLIAAALDAGGADNVTVVVVTADTRIEAPRIAAGDHTPRRAALPRGEQTQPRERERR
jgi:PPM family protein phosphatase